MSEIEGENRDLRERRTPWREMSDKHNYRCNKCGGGSSLKMGDRLRWIGEGARGEGRNGQWEWW